MDTGGSKPPINDRKTFLGNGHPPVSSSPLSLCDQLRVSGEEYVKCTSNEEMEESCSENSSFGLGLLFEDTCSETKSAFDEDVLSLDLNSSLSEGDIQDILFEAGYTRGSIENVMAARLEQSVDKSVNSTGIAESDLSESEPDTESAFDILRKIRVENVNKIMIGTLNINSLASKFDQLREVIGKNLDILTIQETKLDASFPPQQFILDGYSEPYRLDRNRDGGGVMIYVREDIPSKELSKHNFTKYVEGLFVEINLRKTKVLFFGGYRSEHQTYGLTKDDFLEQLGFALDKYCNYDKVLIG